MMSRSLAGHLILFALLGIARLEDAPQVDEDGHVIDPFASHERLVKCAKMEEESDEEEVPRGKKVWAALPSKPFESFNADANARMCWSTCVRMHLASSEDLRHLPKISEAARWAHGSLRL